MPISILKIKYADEFIYLNTAYSFTRPFHPFGRCLKILLPENAKNGSINEFIFKQFLSGNKSKDLDGFNIFLRDPFSSSDLKHPSFQMSGDILSALLVNRGFMNYKAKISQNVHFEKDPNFKCKSYSNEQTYDF